MKIGGNGEFWMVIGPLIAALLVATVVAGGPGDMLVVAERFTNDAWSAVVVAFRR